MAVLAFAAVVIFFRLGEPRALVFDEVYYARDARSYRLGATENQGIDACNRKRNPAAVCSWVHPPLGKLLISLGERTGPVRCPSPTQDSGGKGCNPWQWRLVSGVAGLLTVALLILLARLLFGSWVWASAAGMLLALDGLFLVQARIAMLDVFLQLFVVAGALLVVWDHLDRRADSRRSRFDWRRFAAGACFGAAAAVKWTGALALVAAWTLVVVWALAARMRARRAVAQGAPPPEDTPRPLDGLAWLCALVAVPAVVYALAWVPYLIDHGGRVHDLAELHKAMWRYHRGLTADHPYKSPAWQWPLLWRPVAYYFEAVRGDRVEVLAIGNPVLWWASMPAILGLGGVLAWPDARRRAGPAPAVILAFYGMLYLPWLVVSRPQFLFYMTPVVPFMALAVTWWAARLWPARGRVAVPGAGWRRGVVIAVFAGVLIAFAAFYPVWTAWPIPYDWWRHLLVFRSWI